MSAAVIALPGIAQVTYNAQEDLFVVSFDAGRISVENIFAAVHMAGGKIGQEYFPLAVP